jgi:hypothetical protein
LFCFLNIVGELYGISENKHPGFADISVDWGSGEITGGARPHDFFSNRDTYLGHGGQTADEAHIADVSEGLAVFLI